MIYDFAVSALRFIDYVIAVVCHVFWSGGSPLSLAYLGSAFCIASATVAFRRRTGHRRVRPRVVLRALFPKKWLLGMSARADIGYFLLNTFASGALIGWALLSAASVSRWTLHGLEHVLGPGAPSLLPGAACTGLLTAGRLLAYEFGYWLDHYVKHRIPALWEFHKVHHTAETLSPLTVFRVHPVDTLVFYNIVAVVGGVADGGMSYWFGKPVDPLTLAGTSIVVVISSMLLTNLQHSHIWLPITGAWGRVLLSPAHHQLHHSNNPEHFGCNLGGCLSVFDALFGTLRLPSRQRERLVFGVDHPATSNHTVTGALLSPFAAAWGATTRSNSTAVKVWLIARLW